jgi:hypothetical protein
MDRLDGLVVDHFCGRVLEPSRLKTLLAELRNRVATQDDIRKRYIRLFIDRIEVDDHEIRIRGPKSVLARGVALGIGSAPETVPSFAQEWRPLGDSNPCYRRERTISDVR